MIRFTFKFDEERLGELELKFLNNRDPRYKCVADAICSNMFEKFNETELEVSSPMYNGDEFFFDRTVDGPCHETLNPLLKTLGFDYLLDENDEYTYLEDNTLRIEYVNKEGKNRFEYMGELLEDPIIGLTIYADMVNKGE